MDLPWLLHHELSLQSLNMPINTVMESINVTINDLEERRKDKYEDEDLDVHESTSYTRVVHKVGLGEAIEDIQNKFFSSSYDEYVQGNE